MSGIQSHHSCWATVELKNKISSFLKLSSLDNDTVLANFNYIIETGCKSALRKRAKFKSKKRNSKKR